MVTGMPGHNRRHYNKDAPRAFVFCHTCLREIGAIQVRYTTHDGGVYCSESCMDAPPKEIPGDE